MALDLTLGNFKSAVGMGTRPNRYTVSMGVPNPDGGGLLRTLEVEVAALSLPESNLPAIQIPFRGRILKLPGDRRFGSWTFTVYDTEDTVWRDLHEWSSGINTLRENKTSTEYEDFTQNWTIDHFSLNGDESLKQVTLNNCWPTIVGPISLAYGAMDQLVQFSCTVEYEFFTVRDVIQ